MTTSQAILTVDAVLLTLVEAELHVALIRREAEPFAGHWGLPGGYIHEQEDDSAKAAIARVLQAKAGVESPYLEEYGTFSGPVRDPRGWSLTVVYFALAPVVSGQVQMFPVHALPNLPFDHTQIIAKVLERVRSKASYSSLPVHLCPPEFTIPELHAVYEVVMGEKLNIANFRRKLEDLQVLEEIPGCLRSGGRSRPSQVYRVSKKYRNALSVRERGL
ncbi:NrtR DNA-binding winged helix domain-containing protein [Rhodoferax sp.]|uniref:NUDIX hydrolase n=1 Tax=Rhodoferax sp. TaxID=50421 RepID=UPI00283B6915|nr:NUDIX domain-containing protein [Rhodoferax sp.]MDR3368117.1 NUDIX domain-containing protein [Rhodoferax sp.]